MAIQREWVCMAHGYFEAPDPLCPQGCTGEGMIERVHTRAPAIQSQGFRNINTTFESLARDAGVGNMNNAGGDGMRKVDYWQRKRLFDQAASLGYGKRSGKAMDEIFKPVSELGGRGGPEQSAIRRTADGRMYSPSGDRGIVFSAPRPVQDAGRPYYGAGDGLPQGDT